MSKTTIAHRITVDIDLQQIPQGPGGKGFKDTQAIIDWISACLNVNTNHVKAKVQEAGEPTVIVELDGGLVQAVRANRPARVITLDADCEGADEEWIDEIDGSKVYWCDRDVEIEPGRVEQIAAEIDAIR